MNWRCISLEKDSKGHTGSDHPLGVKWESTGPLERAGARQLWHLNTRRTYSSGLRPESYERFVTGGIRADRHRRNTGRSSSESYGPIVTGVIRADCHWSQSSLWCIWMPTGLVDQKLIQLDDVESKPNKKGHLGKQGSSP